uniref:Uncharacterized protein n=1 Tax=Anopheles farauti TaxID=69004 RepID=A0A182Q0Q0_9DIPT
MKTIALLLLVAFATVCLAEERLVEAEHKLAAIPSAPLAVNFEKLQADGALTKERLEQFRVAVEALKSKIEATRMNTAHKDAIKKEALVRLADRIAKLRQQVPKKED